MSPWPFVAGAYAVTIVAVAALVVWALVAMQRSEARAEQLKRK